MFLRRVRSFEQPTGHYRTLIRRLAAFVGLCVCVSMGVTPLGFAVEVSSKSPQAAPSDAQNLRKIVDQKVQNSVEEKRAGALRELEKEVDGFRAVEKRKVVEELVPFKASMTKEIERDLERYTAGERSKVALELRELKAQQDRELAQEKVLILRKAQEEAKSEKEKSLKGLTKELEKTRQDKLSNLDREILKTKEDRLKTLDHELQKTRDEKLSKLTREVSELKTGKSGSLEREIQKAHETQKKALEQELQKTRQDKLLNLDREILKAKEDRLKALDKDLQKTRQDKLSDLDRELQKIRDGKLSKQNSEVAELKKGKTEPVKPPPDSSKVSEGSKKKTNATVIFHETTTAAPAAADVPESSATASKAAEGSSAAKPAEAAPEKISFKPGDEIRISVYREPDLTGDFVVDANNSISYPLVGRIEVTSFDSQKLGEHIGSALKKYIVDPQVSVNLKKGTGGGSQTVTAITILGEVKKPGAYDAAETLTLTKLLALSGGLTELADMAKVKIIRKKGDGVEVAVWDLEQITEGTLADPKTEGGDRVVIPAKEEDVEGVVVLGEIKRPGIFEKTKGLTLLRVVAKAGGLTPTADSRHIRIIRRVGDKEHTGVFDINQILAGKLEDPVVENADKIFVPESFF